MNTPHDREDYGQFARTSSAAELKRYHQNIGLLVGDSSAAQAVRWFKRLRIKGPIAGRLYVCYRHDKPGKTATALTPEGAYNAWQSYWGTQA